MLVLGSLTVARICVFGGALLIAGCSMPASGPAGADIKAGQVADPDRLPYALAPLTPKVLDILAQNSPRLSSAFTDRRPPGDIRLGVGDVVSVTIFEAAAGGLFVPGEASARPGNFITLPNQTVDAAGNISIPYAGTIRAMGRTVVEVQRSVADALKNRAIEPQVVIGVVEQRTSMISVLGEVNKPERFPASAAPEHLLDAITRAGGPKDQGYDTWVMLERNEHRATVPFGALVFEPSNNIFVHPNDTIYVYSEPQTFVVFGATAGATAPVVSTTAVGTTTTAAQGQFSFGAWRISLAEAVAKAGGLNDSLADPGSVFLYRGETRQVAEQFGVDCSKFTGPIIPVIYQVNFRDPAGYFLAKQFEMRNKDIIYVSNAASVETSKVLNYLQLIMATADDPIVYATNFYGLQTAIRASKTATSGVILGQ
jgi:polysaccharide export outer membrane protein